MKQLIAFVLSFSLLGVHQDIHTKNLEEIGTCFVGVATAYTGLNMLNNATKKDGTKTQVVVGTLLFGGGLYLTLSGAGTIHTWQSNNEQRFARGRSWQEMPIQDRKKAILDVLGPKISETHEGWKKQLLAGIYKAVELDTTGLLAKTVPWSSCV